MEEQLINQVVGQVMIYDNATKHWLPAGTSSGLSTVRLLHCPSNNTFKIHGQKIDGAKEVVLDSVIAIEDKFNRANDSFVRWHDKHAFWGLNFRPKPKGGLDEANSFFESIMQILDIIHKTNGQNQLIVQQQQQHHHQQQQQQQQSMIAGDQLSNGQQPLHQTNSASVIQRTIQPQSQQMTHQQVVQQSLMHQQPAQMMNIRMINDTHQPQSALLSQGPAAQMIQQPQNQPNTHMVQQQLHTQYLQQQAQSQPQQNQSQMNHYQHTHQQHLQQQQQPPQSQQIRLPPPQYELHQQSQIQQAQQQQQSQPTQVVAAPIPPPPPPPPPAYPLASLNNTRVNGTSNHSMGNNNSNGNNNEAQHSPVATSNNNNNINDRNGGSPNQQVSSLANELMKCQLKKVNLSRSDSEKESECNNNNIANPKTTRAASLAYVPTNLMDDLSKRLASRREKLDQKGDTQSNCSSNSITNGVSNDKSQESWLAELIRKEISKEMSKMKVEILEAIRSELKQR